MLQAQDVINPAMEGLTGLYDFENQADMFVNSSTSGAGSGYTVMCEGVMKFDPNGGTSDDDQPSTFNTDYFWADGVISMNAHNWFKVWHGIPANGGSDEWVNQYTVVIDLKVSDANGIYSLYEVNPTPKLEGYTSEMEIADMKVGIPSGYSTQTLEVDTWYRIVYVADLENGVWMYVNGVLWFEIAENLFDGGPAGYGADTYPSDAAFKIEGNNKTIEHNEPPRDGNKDVDLVAVFDRALEAADVATLGGYSAVSNLQNRNNIKLYPNPANDILTISGVSNANIEIFNITGQIVHSTIINDDNTVVDLSSFRKGIYLVNIIAENGSTLSKKLIIE